MPNDRDGPAYAQAMARAAHWPVWLCLPLLSQDVGMARWRTFGDKGMTPICDKIINEVAGMRCTLDEGHDGGCEFRPTEPYIRFATTPLPPFPFRTPWQPIETAPRDGADIVVGCGPRRDPLYGIAHWGNNAQGWRIWFTGKVAAWPTHWMPLPPLPHEPTECRSLDGI